MQKTAKTYVARIFTFLVLAACLLCVLGLCTACAEQDEPQDSKPAWAEELVTPDTLTVITALDYAPFSSGSAEDPSGYDIAVAKEVANRLGLTLQIVNVPRTEMLSVLTCEKPANASETDEAPEPVGDVALGALAITSQRDELVDFSDWYFVGDQAVICRKPVDEQGTESSKYPTDARKQSSKTTAKQPDSKASNATYLSTTEFDRDTTRIAVVKGSTCLDTAKTLTSEKLVAEYSSAQKCLQALQAKEVQAVVLDLPVANHCLQNGFADLQIIEYIMTGEAYGIALPSQSSNLKDAINEALKAMEEDGTLDRLAVEYL
ncbi:ABC transporter substrate-binding protein [Anaerotardibacter muris]|uniref:ABC transporter substrate-binding protein n=1 Tax=Anaerotardibacter muris TaxID=2941505 RepID=UPI002040CBCE|nr:ABC transporter substrate-binding protein [Anaerotardibacter muris]